MEKLTLYKILLILLWWATLSLALPWRWCQSVYEIGLFIAAGSLFWRWRNEPGRFLNGVLLLLVPAVAATLQLALGTTVDRAASAEALVAWTASFAAAFVARHALANAPLRHQFLTAAAVTGGVVALVCLLQVPLRGVAVAGFTIPDFDLFAGPFPNRNTYAAFAELLLPVALWKAATARKAAWHWWGLAAMMAASVIATGSRAGSMLIVTEIGIVMLVQIRARALFPLTGVVIAVMVAGWDTLGDRLSHEDWSSHRRDLYRSAIAMTVERPLAGHGMGAFESAYPRFAQFDVGRRVNHAHNEWLEWAAEGGLIVPLCLLAFMSLAAWKARAHQWSWGLVFVVAHSIVDYPFQRAGMAGWFWVIAGAALAAASTGQQQHGAGSHRHQSKKKRRSPDSRSDRNRHPLEPTGSTDQSLATAEH